MFNGLYTGYQQQIQQQQQLPQQVPSRHQQIQQQPGQIFAPALLQQQQQRLIYPKLETNEQPEQIQPYQQQQQQGYVASDVLPIQKQEPLETNGSTPLKRQQSHQPVPYQQQMNYPTSDILPVQKNVQYPSNGSIQSQQQQQQPHQPVPYQQQLDYIISDIQPAQNQQDPSNCSTQSQHQQHHHQPNGQVLPYQQQLDYLISDIQPAQYPSNGLVPAQQQPYLINGQVQPHPQQQQQYNQQQQHINAQIDMYLNNDHLYINQPQQQPTLKPPYPQYSALQPLQPFHQYPPNQHLMRLPYPNTQYRPQMYQPLPQQSLPTIPRITEELSQNLDPEYLKELDILYILLQNGNSKDELIAIFSGFAQNHLVLPFLWSYRLELQYQPFMYSIPPADRIQIIKRSLNDFYCNDELLKYQQQDSFKCFDRTFLSHGRRVNWDIIYDGQQPSTVLLTKAKEDLFYPHEHLFSAFKFYEAHSDQILSQKDYLKYKKALQFCQRIIAADTLRKLFCCFTEFEEDPRFVIQNVEVLIAQNPTCQWLWKSYLQYLRDRQPKVYLDVFQKYIRFFISDKAMLQYFEKEKQRIHSTANFRSYQSLENFLFDDIEHENYFQPSHAYRIHNASNFKNAYEQKFSLPPALIQYLLKSASARQLNTLFETCKQIFLLPMTPVCCNLRVSNYWAYYDNHNTRSPCCQQSFKFSSFIPWELQNIFLVKSLIIENAKPATMLSAIISKISRCEIWCLIVQGQSVLLDELKILLESGNVEKFSFTGGFIGGAYMNMVAIEDVVEMLPKAHTVILDSAAFTPETFLRLSNINRQAKFKEFSIEKLFPCFRIFDFEYFITKHAAKNSTFTFKFQSFTPNDFIKKFNNFVTKKLFPNWPITRSKPLISITKQKK